ncbi:hypothetical protein ACQCP0_04460 [Ralstonia pseudosolanacearum]|uniref:hypothetical protein n=1 Tax=Ralstonia pseudosolanacearum TaxID=1310165 RepID=UPI00090A21B7|nr:hypothetical protein [Ralstonia pseudosolanacearum]QKL56796.1 hypothetical protein HI814_08995 [Ralstonia solanacearum]API74679.1 hypothetical protein AC251_08975 [Ralstonia pseudosolanacearum]MCK4127076.1 hypothetical protein [Ralstonia pseudosolanacearum]QKM32848.1 hypothetical protein HI794_08990 [Ralstonia solanacearum]QKM37834.1 hypothetical protein HI793_09000 [Ralstonia solanacearum]
MTITTDRAALILRVAELEAEVRIWRAAAVAEDAYASLRAQAGSSLELAAFDRLQKAMRDRAPLRALAIHAACTERRAT